MTSNLAIAVGLTTNECCASRSAIKLAENRGERRLRKTQSITESTGRLAVFFWQDLSHLTDIGLLKWEAQLRAFRDPPERDTKLSRHGLLQMSEP